LPDWNKVEHHKLIGSFEAPIAQHTQQFLQNESSKKSQGQISLYMTNEPIRSINEYFKDHELNIIVGIDFTVSNGPLHAITNNDNPCELVFRKYNC
jgi:hypothetical protein